MLDFPFAKDAVIFSQSQNLLVGHGIDWYAFLQAYAYRVLCEDRLNMPCLRCRSCKALQAKTHPDFFLLGDASCDQQTRQTIKIDDVRCLCERLTIKARFGAKQLVCVPYAERLTTQAANALLKMVEEPKTNAYWVFATGDQRALIATLRSRLITTHLSPQSARADKASTEPLHDRLLHLHGDVVSDDAETSVSGAILQRLHATWSELFCRVANEPLRVSTALVAIGATPKVVLSCQRVWFARLIAHQMNMDVAFAVDWKMLSAGAAAVACSRMQALEAIDVIDGSLGKIASGIVASGSNIVDETCLRLASVFSSSRAFAT